MADADATLAVAHRDAAAAWGLAPEGAQGEEDTRIMSSQVSAREATDVALRPRIDAMFARDKLWAFGFVVVLWLVLAFVLLAVNVHMPDGNIRTVCWIAALALVLFNTASIVAMVRHYAHDKEHIYGIDIRHLDDARAQRRR